MQNFRYLDLFIQIQCAFASVGNFKSIRRPINNSRNNCPTIQSNKHTKHNHHTSPDPKIMSIMQMSAKNGFLCYAIELKLGHCAAHAEINFAFAVFLDLFDRKVSATC